MGGKAAKERRRLERLSKQKRNFTKKVTQPKKRTTKKENEDTSRQTKTFRNGDHISKAIPHHGPKKRSKHHVKELIMEKNVSKKKNGIKKPKHLKRKLEQATDESAKKQLEEELNILKARKELFSLGKKTEKGQKKPRMSKAESSKQGNAVISTRKQTCNVKEERDSYQKTNNEPNKQPLVLTEEEDQEVKLTAKDQVVEIFKSKPAKESMDDRKSLANQDQVPMTNGTEQETKGITYDNPSPSAKRLNVTHDRDTDDSSSSEDDIEQPVKRQRGRRRRGRIDTEQRVQDLDEKNKVKESTVSNPDDVKEKINIDEPGKDSENRRCLGRKPVTDFKIGEKYPGEVVYIKPFGAFIDIMCHSEAFCHVSRIQDGFIKSPDEVLSIKDKVVARIVEIDRKLKRITVSLQTDERITDELASVEARKARLSKRERKKDKSSWNASNHKPAADITEILPSKPEESNTNDLVDAKGNYLKSESEMTPAELKRARKLARRAQRRAEKEATGLSA
mmetsp:Transcript_18268/g.27680  ORF Transcript_18268/g.27680 Transcript_18268/m.27680 type:complete len:507 (+) Transcript_18268:69-1589(+)